MQLQAANVTPTANQGRVGTLGLGRQRRAATTASARGRRLAQVGRAQAHKHSVRRRIHAGDAGLAFGAGTESEQLISPVLLALLRWGGGAEACFGGGVAAVRWGWLLASVVHVSLVLPPATRP